MNVNYEMKVTPSIGLNFRSGPGIGYRKLGALVVGTVIRASESENGWYKHDKGGWSDGKYLSLIKDYGSTPSAAVTPTPPADPAPPPLTDFEKEMLNSVFSTADSHIDEIDSIRYLYGAPMQFTPTTDPRPDGSALGRTYMETMLNDMSMLVLTPGKTAFMENFSKGGANQLLSKLVGGSRDEDDESSSIKDILEGKETGRYYSFKSDYVEYMKYVNNMCRLSAKLLNIGDSHLFDGSKEYQDFDWDIANLGGKSKLFSFLTQEKSVAFFIDGKQSSFSDGMSNSTDSSMLEGALGTGSQYAKEALFLFGKGYQDEALINTSKVNYESAVNKVIKTLTRNETLAQKTTDRISDHAATLINGGNIAFPEIWKDSSYSKSYNIELKLVAPYGDVESFYLYILVPLWHLIAMSYPRQLGANGYINPFLVRAFCKGWFNCTMGIIDSISIKRAAQDGWTIDGYPTEVDVSISIKDLYENLALSRAGDFSTLHNTEYLDMIATWCGVNMNKPEMSRKISLYSAFIKNSVLDFFPNITQEIQQDISNKIRSFLK